LNLFQLKDWVPDWEATPSALDSEGPQEDWYVVPVSRSKYGELLDDSNFRAAAGIFQDEGIEYDILRFHHWTVRWIDVLITPDAKAAERIRAKLEDYPALDDDDFAEAEQCEIVEYWSGLCLAERVNICGESGDSIFAARRDAPPRNAFQAIRALRS